MWAKFADLINCAKFHLHWLSSFGAPGVRKSPFPIDLRYRSYNSVRTNVLHYDQQVELEIHQKTIEMLSVQHTMHISTRQYSFIPIRERLCQNYL